MKKNEKKIWVYADWETLHGPRHLGMLTAQVLRGKEIFSFEYNETWMSNHHEVLFLDPNLQFYKGKQFLPEERRNFGMFLDSAPDRWGRLLMQRKEALNAQVEGRAERVLFESDYLLGVFDGHRQGALRFKLDPEGAFMNNQEKLSTPPWTSLRALERASLQLENDDAINHPEYGQWLNLLMDPGSSLGGARPKASVVDEKGHLWIAKFPSAGDHKNSGAWEMLLQQLAKACGILVPEAKYQKFSGKHDTFLSKRFDRSGSQRRIHFASAMTLLDLTDGADYHSNIGYLDLAGFIVKYSPLAHEDLEQLWRRMLFNILVSNTDDHLRNHGFLLTVNGWRLSPAYDMNPNELGNGLTLNITENSNEQDISLAIQTAGYYQIKNKRADEILLDMKAIISNWRTMARKLGISNLEIDQMKRAFRLVNE